MPAPRTYDIAIIGGGASGLAAAIAAARAGARTLIIERNVACGLPILATGNGRCNLSNTNLDPARYRHPDFAREVMGEAPEGDLVRFFESVGIVTAVEDGRLYPRSKRAESVRDALVGTANRAAVEMLLGSEVASARHNESGWDLSISTPSRPLAQGSPADKTELRRRRKALANAARKTVDVHTKRCIIATGGASAHISQLFGLQHLEEGPVLCPIAGTLALGTDALAALDGLRINAELTLRRKSHFLWRETGEVLFRSYGISGIVAFNMSRRVLPGDTIELNLFPMNSPWGYPLTAFERRSEILAPLTPADPAWFDGLCAPALGRLLARACHGDIEELAHICQHLRFAVDDLTEQKSAQVRRGGIYLPLVSPDTLEIEPKRGLYACGEALDMDADCGGFNLAWAWMSGLTAGTSAAASI